VGPVPWTMACVPPLAPKCIAGYFSAMTEDLSVLMTAAEVAKVLGVSQGRVTEILAPTVRLSPRRARWSREAVRAVVEGKKVPANLDHAILRGLPKGPLSDGAVAGFLRCPVAAVPFLELARAGGAIEPHALADFIRSRM